MPGTVLGTGDRAVNKTGKNPHPGVLAFYSRVTAFSVKSWAETVLSSTGHVVSITLTYFCC